MENYHLNVSGDASSLKSELDKIAQAMDSLEKRDGSKGLDNWAEKLKEIEKLTKNVSEAFEKNKNNTVMPYKEMEKMSKSAIDATVHMNDLKKAMDNLSKDTKLSGTGLDVEAKKVQKSIQREIENTKQKAMDLSKQKISPDASIRDAQKDMKMFGDETRKTAQAYKELSNMKSNFTKDRRDFSEANRINRGGMTTGSVTYNDRQRLDSHMSKRSDYLTRARSFRKDNKEDEKTIRSNDSKISDLMRQQQTPGTKEKIAALKNETEAIQKNIVERNKEAEEYRRMAQELKGMQSTMSQYDTKSKRGSFKATLEDRAPSIGMAAVGGTMAFVGSSYMRGETSNKNLRDDMFFRGNLFGNDDYRDVRRNMYENSIDNGYGYDAQTTNSMAKSYLSYNEQVDSQEDLDKGINQFQRSGRALNIDTELMSDAYATIGKTGGMTGDTELSTFTNTFVGALDKSKMSARSEEQLKSLESMVGLMGQNRDLSSSEISDAVAMQSMMASTGNKSLQGEKGANAINNMTEAMQGGINDPLMLQMMGYGSEFTDREGRKKAQSRLEKGATYDNINRIMDFTGGGISAQEVLVNKMGVSTEQAEAFTEMYDNGDLSKKNFDKYKEEIETEGEKKATKDSDNVKDSKENKMNVADQKEEYQNSKTADNLSWIKEAKGAMASLNNAGYLLTGAAIALAGSMGTSVGMAGGATVVRKATGKLGKTKFGGKVKNSRVGQATGKAKNKASTWWNGGDTSNGTGTGGGNPRPDSGGNATGGGIPTPGGTSKSTKTNTNPSADPKTNTNTSGTGGTTAKNPNTPNTKGGMKGLLKNGNKFGKGFGALGLLTGGLGLLGSIKDNDASGIGSSVGDMGGMYGGASLGATVGSLVMPGVGTAIGAGIGGLAGSSVGSHIGQYLGEKAEGLDSQELDENGKPKKIKNAWNGASHTGNYGLVGKLFGWGKDKDKGILTNRKSTKKKRDKKKSEEEKRIEDFKNRHKKKKKEGKGGGGGAGGSAKEDRVNLLGTGEQGRISTEEVLAKYANEDAVKGDPMRARLEMQKSTLEPEDKKGKKKSSKKSDKRADKVNLLGTGDYGRFTTQEVLDGYATEGKEKGDPMRANMAPNSKGIGANKTDVGKGKKQKVSQMDVERLREKNVNKETENITKYWNALNRFGQLIQEAKSLDLGTGGAESGSDSGKSADDVGGKGKEKVWKFLKAKGLSDDQAAAIMGNLEQESGLDPTAENRDSGAFGIAQWMDSRKAGLDAFAKKEGKKNTDLGVQLDYLWSEMQGSEKQNLGRFNKANSIGDATTFFANDFERMGADEAMMNTRISNAKAFKEKYGGGGKGGGGGSDWDTTLSNLNPLLSSQGSGSTTTNNNDNRNYTVNVNVTGTNNPEQTAQATASKIETLLNSSSNFFSNEHTRK